MEKESASAVLRKRTAAAHARVDAKFGAYDLGNPGSYCTFLLAHASALPVAERIMASSADLPSWQPRTPLLAEDLKDMNRSMPAPLTLQDGFGSAAPWGFFYVIQGSRLGGSVLAKRVPADLPVAYLDAGHRSGEWRLLCKAIDAAAAQRDTDWLDQAVDAANTCFHLFERAAYLRPPATFPLPDAR